MERRTIHERRLAIGIGIVGALIFAVISPTRADLNTNSFNSANGETWNDPQNSYYDESWIDWEDNKGSVTVKSDIANRAIDDAFGQGTKEDNPLVTITDGSVPPNKSDLTNFYFATQRVESETTYAHTYLYLAWTRTNVLGSANMDFELNQVPPDLTKPGTQTLQRTAGDMLITYDFDKGGTYPSIAALFWVTAGSSNRCYAANRLPCWGDRIVLLNDGEEYESEYAEGAINQTAFFDNVNTLNEPGSTDGVPRAAFTFGELAIDLSLVLPDAFGENPTKCSGLSSVFLKSRSSSSFTAEIKDFIAPHLVSFSNCGAVKVVKTGKDASATGGTRPLSGAQFRLVRTADGAVIDTKTTGADGTICFDNVLLNTENQFTVAEIASPTGYADSAAQQVTVEAGTSCAGNGESAPAILNFVDDPLTTITVSTTPLAGAGVTKSTVQCVKTSTAGTDTGETTTSTTPRTTIALKPGTYDCTVVIDP